MSRRNLEVSVGIFVIAGILALGYLSIKLGKLEVIGGTGYEVKAEFSNIGGLKTGSTVEIAGVGIGRVTAISLKDYQADVHMSINRDVKLSDDSMASIRTKGLIGEKFIEVTPGGSEKLLKSGSTIRDTESAIDFEKLIANYIFGKV